MTSYDDLTETQRALYDGAQQKAFAAGCDTREVVPELSGSSDDKRQVIEALGGPIQPLSDAVTDAVGRVLEREPDDSDEY